MAKENSAQEVTKKYAGVSALREIVDTCAAIGDAQWGRGGEQAALEKAERLRLDGNVPVDLLIELFTNWGQVAARMNKLPNATALLKRAEGILPRNASVELVTRVKGLDGVLAAWRGDMVRREQLYCQMLRALPSGSAEYLRISVSQAHFLALMGRESEVDAELGTLDCKSRRATEQVLLVRFIQAIETGRFADAMVMADTVRRFAWDISGHRAFFLNFLDVVVFRWRLAERALVPGADAVDPAAEGLPSLPPWAEVMDHLLANHPVDALACAKREAGGDLNQCLTRTGLDSFNLIRAELANGNWQAAVRLIGLRRDRGNIHYLDDYFLAVACLLADQCSKAAAHFARVEKACAQHDAFGRLEFELRMACALRPGDIYWLTRAAAAVPAVTADAVTHPLPPAIAAKGLAHLIGTSEAMTAVRDAIMRLAQVDATLLITGETGVGKELVARAVHECGPRSEAPFLAVNCGAIPESLLESELFGHERSAFTGAVGAHRGLFESAGVGTILLDEIGEIPPRLQIGLLRILESGEIRPVGGTAVRKARCRIIAATNAELDKLMARGIFRKDLYYRLARLVISIPPLRERPADIVPLARHFLAEARVDGATPRLSAKLEEALRRLPWTGNVRDLRNVVERMRLFGSEKPEYCMEDLCQAEPALGGKDRGEGGTGPSPTPDRVTEPLPATALAATGQTADDMEEFLRGGRTALRRLDRLREFFVRYRKLTRAEVAAILDVAPKTATADLKVLCREGFVLKIKPGASRRTHYFVHDTTMKSDRSTSQNR